MNKCRMPYSICRQPAFIVLLLAFCSGCATTSGPDLSPACRQAAQHTLKGLSAFERRDSVRALEEFKESFRIYASLDNEEGMAVALINMSRLYRLSGDLPAARDAAKRALPLCASIPEVAREAYFEEGKIALSSGAEAEARQWAEKGLAASDQSADPRFINLLGSLDLRAKEVAKAQERGAAALELSRTSGNREEEANALLLLAETRLATKESAVASDLFGQALAISKEIGNSGKTATALRGLAEAAIARNDRSAAIGFYLRASSAGKNGGDLRGTAEDLERLAAIYEENGDKVSAQASRDERNRLIKGE